MTLAQHPDGGYRYLPAIAAYSSGIVAEPGHSLLGIRFGSPRPLAESMTMIDRAIEERGLAPSALAALQLRSPAALPPDGFGAFNDLYLELLDERGLLLDGHSPLSRTNVVPTTNVVTETVIHAAYLVVPEAGPRPQGPDFVVAGSGEAIGGLGPEHIVAHQDVSPRGLAAKRDAVLQVMVERMDALGVHDLGPTQIGVYTAFEVPDLVRRIGETISASTWCGLTVFPSRPPVVDIDFEMDCLHVSAWATV